MARKTNRPIPVESVQIGDLCVYTWKDGDITRTAYARLASIDYRGHVRILLAESGAEITRYNIRNPREVQCVPIEFYVPVGPALFDL